MKLSLAFLGILLSSFSPSRMDEINQQKANTEVIPLGTGINYKFKGLAIDSIDQVAYLGSWNKKEIVKISLEDHSVTFIDTKYSKRLNAMGTYLANGLLYTVMNEVDDDPEALPLSVLVIIDTKTLKVVRSYESVGVNGRNHFNHVVISNEGVAYISNTLKSSIYTVDTTNPADTLRPLIQHEFLDWVHGIDLSPDGSTLFTTSYGSGIKFLDLNLLRFHPYHDIQTNRNDGLKYHRGVLYGVGENTVWKYQLNDDMNNIVKKNIVLKDHPMFNDPRCLHVTSDHLYCLANITLEPVTFRRSGKVSRTDKLDDSYIIKIPIE